MDRQGVELKWLLFGMFLGSIGNSFVWPLTIICIHGQLHESLTVSGIALLFYSGVNVVGSYISGMLFDRANPRELMTGGTLLVTIVMAIMIFFDGWPVCGVLLTVIEFLSGWIITMVSSFATHSSRDGRYVFDMLYFANNLGMVIGTTIVGPLYQYTDGNVSPVFLITTILYTMFSLVVIFFFKDSQQAVVKTEDMEAEEENKTVNIKMPQVNLWVNWVFFIALVVAWTTYEQWASNLSVFMTDQGISMTRYSLLWTLNGILIVVFQLGITWLNRRVNQPYAQIFIGMFTIGFSFILLLYAHSYSWFVAVIVVLTIGEVTALPTMPAIVNSLSPVTIKGKYQGILNAFSSLGKAIGPLFGGLMIEVTSYHILLITCTISIFVVEIIVVFVIKIKRAKAVEY